MNLGSGEGTPVSDLGVEEEKTIKLPLLEMLHLSILTGSLPNITLKKVKADFWKPAILSTHTDPQECFFYLGQ